MAVPYHSLLVGLVVKASASEVVTAKSLECFKSRLASHPRKAN